MSNLGKKGRGWADLQLQTIPQYFRVFFKPHFHSFLKAQMKETNICHQILPLTNWKQIMLAKISPDWNLFAYDLHQ